MHACGVMVGLAGVCLALAAEGLRGEEPDLFESQVRPLLAQHCYKCHGPVKQKGGVRLDGPDHLVKAVDGQGPVVVPGDPAQSRLIKVVLYSDESESKMPPSGKLPDAAIDALARWVKEGATWPVEKKPNEPKPAAAVRAKHWAYQPVKRPEEPEVKDATWPASPIDRFILARLEARGMTPSPPADRRTLLRRLTFDLTGLPPTEAQIDAFDRDTSPDATARLVDRLLGSPQFAERWARHWLDVARYADSKGPISKGEIAYPSAYTYRDWVVRALAADLPYDQFLTKQIAADCQMRVQNHPDLAALGFLTLGRKFEESKPDIIDDRLDVIFRGTQGVSISCARCHDHKYDPISIRDYYSLYGVFAGATEKHEVIIFTPQDRLAAQAHAAELLARTRDLEHFLEAERKRLYGDHRRKAAAYLLAGQEALNRASASADAEDRDSPRSGPYEKDDPNHARPDGLNPAVVELYKTVLENTRGIHHRVLAPWHAFAQLAPEEFATRGKTLAAEFAANENPDKPLAVLVSRLFAGKPPADPADLAGRYGKLFAAIARKWDKQLTEADRADRPRPTELVDEAEDEIRQVICGPAAPLDERAIGEINDKLDPERKAKLAALEKAVLDWKNDPSAPPLARVLEESEEPPPACVFKRGKPEEPGDVVPRQFLPILSRPDAKPFTEGSGRYELAKAIASKNNPLTARVWVNRVWTHLMGRGLVATLSDFGVRSDPPSHPELLDWLACALMEDGWSTKRLIRTIVLSRAYQQSSDDRGDGREIDPANELYWRANRKRLELEPLRDAMLMTAGTLDLTVGGRSVNLADQPDCRRRTLYLAVRRENLPSLFRAFDFANPDLHVPARHETTVPQQALFLLNSPFVAEAARALACRASAETGDDESQWVRRAFRIALGREPESRELDRARVFLAAAASL
ncbi:MAG: PSD1 domain-containing protein, partial [Planctomycetaceae bacterium]|nr:PSD1 domain-containing protein [Planctomycetaceae bacterium]